MNQGINRLLGRGFCSLGKILTNMKWIRIKIPKYTTLSYPDLCPNCLSKVHHGSLRISRSLSFGFASIQYHIDWPHCDDCIQFDGLKRRTQHLCLIVTFAAIFLLIALSFALAFSTLHTYVKIGVYGGCILPIILCVIYYQRTISQAQKQSRRITRHMAVKLFRGGKRAFSEDFLIDFAVLHPVYAQKFITLNADNPTLTYNEEKLNKLLKAFHKKN